MKIKLLQVALIFSFIPNVSFSITNFDTQPFAFILGFAATITFLSNKIPIGIWLLILPSIATLIIALASTTLIDGLRSLVIYSSPWVFASLAYLSIKKKIDISTYIGYMLFLWFLIALIQWVINPQLFEFFVSARTTTDRGVTSLAPEPSFYGLSIIQMWLVLLMIKPDYALRPLIIGLCIFQVFLMAQSTLAIIIFIIIFLTYALRNVILLFISIFAATFLTFYIQNTDNKSNRFFLLLEGFLESPSDILYMDGSISDRFYHIFLSLKYSSASGFSPHGFSEFSDLIIKAKLQYDSFWWGEASNKIMSGIGGALFELGWLAFIYFVIFYAYLVTSRDISFGNKLAIGMGTFLILLNSVTMAAPFFGIMIGIMAAGNLNQLMPKLIK